MPVGRRYPRAMSTLRGLRRRHRGAEEATLRRRSAPLIDASTTSAPRRDPTGTSGQRLVPSNRRESVRSCTSCRSAGRRAAQGAELGTSVGNGRGVDGGPHASDVTPGRGRPSHTVDDGSARSECSAIGRRTTWSNAVSSLGAGTTSAPHVRPSALARASGVDVPVPSVRRTCADPMATNPARRRRHRQSALAAPARTSAVRRGPPTRHAAPRTQSPVPPAGPPISALSARSSSEPKAMSVPFPLRTKPAAAGTTSSTASVHDTPSGEAVHSSSDDQVYDRDLLGDDPGSESLVRRSRRPAC